MSRFAEPWAPPVIRMDPFGHRRESLDYLDSTINGAVIEAKAPRWRAGAIAAGAKVVNRQAPELLAAIRGERAAARTPGQGLAGALGAVYVDADTIPD